MASNSQRLRIPGPPGSRFELGLPPFAFRMTKPAGFSRIPVSGPRVGQAVAEQLASVPLAELGEAKRRNIRRAVEELASVSEAAGTVATFTRMSSTAPEGDSRPVYFPEILSLSWLSTAPVNADVATAMYMVGENDEPELLDLGHCAGVIGKSVQEFEGAAGYQVFALVPVENTTWYANVTGIATFVAQVPALEDAVREALNSLRTAVTHPEAFAAEGASASA